MQKRKIKSLNSVAFLMLLLLPFFKPASFELIAPGIDAFLDGWRLVSFAVILFMYVVSGKVSKIIVAISAYEAMLLVSTFVNHGDYWHLVVSCGTVIGFCMLTEICIIQNSKKYFTTIFTIYFALIMINLIVLVIFPEGIATDNYYRNTYNFLGNDNSMAVVFELPLMGAACLYSAFRNRRLTFTALLMFIMISATVLITWSATGVVAWFVLAVYILFVYKSKMAKIFNSYILFVMFVAMQIMIVFLRLQEHFAFFIENILGKSISFTGRTLIWDLSYLVILQSPIIGYGVYEGAGLIQVGNAFFYAHNAILEILIQSGVIGLILFIIPFIMAARRLYQYREHFLAGIVSVTLFSFMLTFLMEAQISSIWIFGFLVIADHIPTIIHQYEANAQKRQTGSYRMNTPDLRLQANR